MGPCGHGGSGSCGGGKGGTRGTDGGPAGTGNTGGSGGAAPGLGGRLNLLLSYAGWQAESWADRLPRLLEPMGVCALRAATGREATEVIRSSPIHIAIVDLGLPLDGRLPAADKPCPMAEEAGPRILELLSRQPEPPPPSS
jgi:hypothetical protein